MSVIDVFLLFWLLPSLITLLLWIRLINTWQIEEDVKEPVDSMLWVILIGGSVIYPWGLLSLCIYYTGVYLENKGTT